MRALRRNQREDLSSLNMIVALKKERQSTVRRPERKNTDSKEGFGHSSGAFTMHGNNALQVESPPRSFLKSQGTARPRMPKLILDI